MKNTLKKIATTVAAVSGIGLLTASCSGLGSSGPNVCQCDVVWFDSANQHSDLSVGGLGIENSILDFDCPSGLKLEKPKEKISFAGYDFYGKPIYKDPKDNNWNQLEKEAKSKVVSCTGLTENEVDGISKRRSFINVLVCLAAWVEPGSSVPKGWWKLRPEVSGGKGGGPEEKDICDSFTTNKDKLETTYPSDCEVVDVSENLVCLSKKEEKCTPVSDPAPGCMTCMHDNCCEQYNACVNDTTFTCQCLMECDYLNASCSPPECHQSSLAASQARACLSCVNACPAIANYSGGSQPKIVDPDDEE